MWIFAFERNPSCSNLFKVTHIEVFLHLQLSRLLNAKRAVRCIPHSSFATSAGARRRTIHGMPTPEFCNPLADFDRGVSLLRGHSNVCGSRNRNSKMEPW